MAELDKSKFSLKYLLFGDPANPGKDWLKALGNGWRIAIIVLALILTWKLFFEKKNLQNIHIGSGSQVTIKQGEEKKRAWWIPSPFVELYTYKENDRQGAGGKFGGRFEW